jgi:TorA maturation chaperone TorD
LAECFREPTPEFVKDILSGALARVLDDIPDLPSCQLTLDAQDKSVAEMVEQLTDEYYQTFKGPFPPYVVPVESTYKAWAESNPGAECSMERDMLMGDPAIEMLKRYRADGIELPPAFTAYPDHVALILDYAGLLLERGAPGAYEEFVAAHLDWMEALCRDIHAITESPFYRAAADLLRAFACNELERAAGSPPVAIEHPATACLAR